MRLVTALLLPVALWATGDEDPPAPPTPLPTERWVVQSQQQDYTRAPIIYPDELVPFQVFPGPPSDDQPVPSPTTSPSPEPTPQPTDYPVAKAVYYGSGCTEGSYIYDDGCLSLSDARKTSDYANGSADCQPIEDLCASEGGTLATKEQTHMFIENGGDTLEMRFGLTSTRQGTEYWYTDGTGDLGFHTKSCHDEDLFFVCASDADAPRQMFSGDELTLEEKAEAEHHAEQAKVCDNVSKSVCAKNEGQMKMCEWDDGGEQGEDAASCHLNFCYGMLYQNTCESNSQYCKWEDGTCHKKECKDFDGRSVCIDKRHCLWKEDDWVLEQLAAARDAEEDDPASDLPTANDLETEGDCEHTDFYEEGTVTCEGYKLGDNAVTAYVPKEDVCQEACASGGEDCIGYWTFSHIDLQEPNNKFFCALYIYNNVSWRPKIKCGQNDCEFGNPRGDNFSPMEGAEVNKCRSHALGARTDETPPSPESSEDYDRLDVWVLLLALLVACCFAVGGFYTYNYIRDEELKRELTREAMLGNDEVYQ